MSLIDELKRRNVLKVALAYIGVSWLLLQVADVILNNFGAPHWVFKALAVSLGLGLPLAMAFTWAFELTPEGLKREGEVDRSLPGAIRTGRKLNFLVIGALVLALGYFAFDRLVFSPAHDSSLFEPAVQPIAEKSIAVLPFVNMSSDAEQEYFSDGMSEELLNLLARIPELKVASRTSAFQFKGEKVDLVEVARKLRVAYVLEGSVRKSGDQLRVTAQLIKADDGYHLWSQTYDRSLENIFAIQDEISAAVVGALKIQLLGEVPKAEVVNPEAYALFLKGRYLHAQWGRENFAAAVDAYQQALILDPGYAEAWASLSVTLMSQVQSGYSQGHEGRVLARAAVDRALSLNPNLATAWARLAQIQCMLEWDWAGAEKSVQRALELAPTDHKVLGAASVLANTLGRPEEALAYLQRVLDNDPFDLVNRYDAASTLHRLGRLEESAAAYRRLLELNPQDWGSHTQLAIILLEQGRAQEAWNELEREVDLQQQEYGQILALTALGKNAEADQRLASFIAKNQDQTAYLIATAYAWQGDADAAFRWLEVAFEQRDGSMSGLLTEPLLASLRGDSRWPELIHKMGLSRSDQSVLSAGESS